MLYVSLVDVYKSDSWAAKLSSQVASSNNATNSSCCLSQTKSDSDDLCGQSKSSFKTDSSSSLQSTSQCLLQQIDNVLIAASLEQQQPSQFLTTTSAPSSSDGCYKCKVVFIPPKDPTSRQQSADSLQTSETVAQVRKKFQKLTYSYIAANQVDSPNQPFDPANVHDRWFSFQRPEWKHPSYLALLLAQNSLYFMPAEGNRHRMNMIKCAACRKQFPERNVLRSSVCDVHDCLRAAKALFKLHAQRSSLCTLCCEMILVSVPPTASQWQQMVAKKTSDDVPVALAFNDSDRFQERCKELQRKLADCDCSDDEYASQLHAQIVSELAAQEFEPDVTFNLSESQWSRMYNEQSDEGYLVQSDLRTIVHSAPKHAQYVKESQRVASFVSCSNNQFNALQLAEAGFFYNDSSCLVTCFWCNASLKTDDSSLDEPWIQHAFASDSCVYLLMCKGRRFVDCALSLPCHKLAHDMRFSRYTALTGFVAPNSHKVEAREIRAFCALPCIRSLYDWFNYPKFLVQFYVEMHFEETGCYPSTVQVIEGVCELQLRAKQAEQTDLQNFLQKVLDARLALLSNLERNDSVQSTASASYSLRTSFEPDVNKLSPTASTAATPTSSSTEPSNQSLVVDLRSLQACSDSQQEEELGDDACRVCLGQKKNSIFSPCMHRVCCTACSKRLSTCPICRQKIKQIIFYYDS